MTTNQNDTEPTVQFGELPDCPRGNAGKWTAIADALCERPGEWAKVDTTDTNVKSNNRVTAIKRGSFKAMPRGEFEAVRRGLDVWARYVGGQS